MKRLIDILACPVCHGALQRGSGDELTSAQGMHRFPVVNGVPILFPDGRLPDVEYDAPLTLRTGYDPWVHRNVLQSLLPSQVVLDIGAGNMTLDDPCIIRMDVVLTPYVDIVADAHTLPFRDDSIEYIISLAVLEHLRQPFVAGQEMYRVLQRGGYVYCDTNFVFAYHGYPHHYFNSTLHGLDQVFADFTRLCSGVPPYQMPSYAVDNILNTYLQHFAPSNLEEIKFVRDVQKILSYPLRAYDAKFDETVAYRFSAGVYYLGMKQKTPVDTVLPDAFLAVYRRETDLQARFPNPYDLTKLDNLATWARQEGQVIYPEIKVCLDSDGRFNKYWDDRPTERDWIDSLPPRELAQVPADVPRIEVEAGTALSHGTDRTPAWQLPGKALSMLAKDGPHALLQEISRYVRWLEKRE